MGRNFKKFLRPILTYADECHHGASSTAVAVLKKVNARYVYGVSATPKRGDGLEKITYILLGSIRHNYTAKERAAEQGIKHLVYPRYTRVIDTNESKNDINKAFSLISKR
jgi:superfamily II DNA or RNA helicase